MVFKKGFIVWCAMGDANGSLSTSEPVVHRRMWGALGAAPAELGLTFFSRLALEADVPKRLGLRKRATAIRNTRKLGKLDMVRNTAMPHIEVDPRTFEVRADGRLLTADPPTTVPLFRRYMLR